MVNSGESQNEQEVGVSGWEAFDFATTIVVYGLIILLPIVFFFINGPLTWEIVKGFLSAIIVNIISTLITIGVGLYIWNKHQKERLRQDRRNFIGRIIAVVSAEFTTTSTTYVERVSTNIESSLEALTEKLEFLNNEVASLKESQQQSRDDWREMLDFFRAAKESVERGEEIGDRNKVNSGDERQKPKWRGPRLFGRTDDGEEDD